MKEPFILFELAGTTYGVRAAAVQRLDMIEQITRVPNTAPYMDGIAWLRGQVVPVMSLRRRFALEDVPYDERSRLIVLNQDGRLVGLAVDTAREFISLDSEAIQPSPEALGGVDTDYLEGLAALDGRLVLIVDVARLLRAGEALSDSPSEGAPHAER